METTIENKRLIKVIDFYKRVYEKEEFHQKKFHRARKSESVDLHYTALKFYRDLSSRARTLIFSLKRNDKFGTGRDWWEVKPEEYKKRKLEEKEKRKQEFENNYRVALHFMQNSLNADYGSFKFDKCGSIFYNSPSDGYLGAKNIYECCCGNCVNSLMVRNRQEEIYN